MLRISTRGLSKDVVNLKNKLLFRLISTFIENKYKYRTITIRKKDGIQIWKEL